MTSCHVSERGYAPGERGSDKLEYRSWSAHAERGADLVGNARRLHIERHRGIAQDTIALQREGVLAIHVVPVRADEQMDGAVDFDATLALTRRELSAWQLVRYPIMTARVLAGIYAHAARLKLKGAPYHPHPATR